VGERVALGVPPGTVDCHVHVFDPVRHPYELGTYYAAAGQELGTPVRLAAVLDWHGIEHALLVGPNSGYGTNNGCLVDALTAGAGRYRGMAVVANDVSRSELAELQSIGVVGVTLNAALLGVEYYADTEPLLANLAALGMIADVQVIDDQLLALSPVLERSGVRVHVDHCGRPDPASGIDAPGFRELLGWGRAGRAVVKLSGCTKAPRSPPSRTRTPTCVPTSARSSRSSDPTTAYGARTGLSCACPNASTTARSWRCSPSRSPTTARARRSCPTLRAANTASPELGCPAVRPRTPGTGCSGRIKGDSSKCCDHPTGGNHTCAPASRSAPLNG
jgi:predicted TIM-barrel fold metal-dependent hydrolase